MCYVWFTYENLQHILFLCPLVNSIWNQIVTRWDIDRLRFYNLSGVNAWEAQSMVMTLQWKCLHACLIMTMHAFWNIETKSFFVMSNPKKIVIFDYIVMQLFSKIFIEALNLKPIGCLRFQKKKYDCLVIEPN